MALEAKGLIRKTFFASLKTFIYAAGPIRLLFQKGGGGKRSGREEDRSRQCNAKSHIACTGQIYFSVGIKPMQVFRACVGQVHYFNFWY